jgi:hypothetical protein
VTFQSRPACELPAFSSGRIARGALISLSIPLSVASLCAETWFLLHESLRVLLDTKQRLIKVVSVSEGTLNEALSEHAKSLNR